MKKYITIFASIAMLSMIPLSLADQGTYKLEVDENTFDVSYSLDGELIAMDVDQESTSLLIGTQNVNDSFFEVSFSSELLSAQNAEFVVLVDGLEADYTVTYDGDNPALAFPIPADSEEIEIIGTSVIPEFPLGALAIMGAVSTMAIILTRMRQRLFK
ncbi:hypothetical protein C4565_06065 [Candidatus Parcubacteria bacterium]|nr:MAG: hypothetical protein C4565_06065 [Candidatus Parcubacteria bacterium]